MKNDWKSIAETIDRDNPLSSFRERFKKDDPRLIYLDGNSLGMLPVDVEKEISALVDDQWGSELIGGWNGGWWNLPVKTGGMIAGIIGAAKDEVIVCDSTSINLYKLLKASLKLMTGRRKIVTDEMNFPSDLYIMQGVIEESQAGHILEIARSADGINIEMTELERLIDDDTAVVVLSHVAFKSGFMYNMKKVTDLVHNRGALVIWDLCHSAGATVIDLEESGADMAVGCTYKYMNGGPGSPSFLFVRRELQKQLVSPVWGWLGEKNPFEFSKSYRPAPGIRQFLTGTPGILSMSTLKPALEITLEAGPVRIRERSIKLTGFLLEMSDDLLVPLGFMPGSPADPEYRGSHISLKHPEGYRICKALIDPDYGEHRVIPDFRPPDNIRLGIAPLYNSCIDIYNTLKQMESIVRDGVYNNYSQEVEGVT